jgi:hypothetical protein
MLGGKCAMADFRHKTIKFDAPGQMENELTSTSISSPVNNQLLYLKGHADAKDKKNSPENLMQAIDQDKKPSLTEGGLPNKRQRV